MIYLSFCADSESNKRDKEDTSICGFVCHCSSHTKPPWSGYKQHLYFQSAKLFWYYWYL